VSIKMFGSQMQFHTVSRHNVKFTEWRMYTYSLNRERQQSSTAVVHLTCTWGYPVRILTLEIDYFDWYSTQSYLMRMRPRYNTTVCFKIV
jgi:hypothetical protein